ncbi:DUF72 domain-containing protein [Desertibacillus haloalkaliphilus]|uniref:DUF72 domain-containing protein n=1 Tax=Desertibacillus haloalkaliphilus TaxID=1328930 RepID=UPI001C2768D4|nr:DUF72 domain-containing protein [Desertibacillus haloalkaliphilus]MBU8906606.1 DUF72 domain-containing protein [Desertibacillus haloalkaliphilus]
MIYIGLTGWGDHDDLYTSDGSQQEKLKSYSGHFPIVEVDASFYAVQPHRNYEKWVRETPDDFRFIVKAYQGITGHNRGQSPFDSREQMYEAFVDSLEPLIRTGKLAMVLCQFPPWFDCKKEHVQLLRYCKAQLEGLPAALEFRHQSWFSTNFREKTLAFMEQEGWIHSICDEPQAGSGSVPTVLKPTDSNVSLVRMHGRNQYGWNDPGTGNWRDVRYLYKYNEEELLEWKKNLEQLQQQTEDIYVLFNNNSGGDAAGNAKQLIELLGIEYEGLAPRQLDLF